jgi:hypothetical protein
MKTACEVVGGPYEGIYVDENWPSTYSEPMRGWASATGNFMVGKSLITTYPVATQSPHDKAKGREAEANVEHRYEVVSRRELKGVMQVRLEYRGSK